MIKVYPVKVEAVYIDETNDSQVLFTLETFDEDCAEFKMDKLVYPEMLDELFAAIRKGVDLLELKSSDSE